MINGSYVAAHGSLNIWAPAVVANETSSSQIQFISENGPQSLGAGWMVTDDLSTLVEFQYTVVS